MAAQAKTTLSSPSATVTIVPTLLLITNQAGQPAAAFAAALAQTVAGTMTISRQPSTRRAISKVTAAAVMDINASTDAHHRGKAPMSKGWLP